MIQEFQRKTFILFVAALAVLAVSSFAWAQTWPITTQGVDDTATKLMKEKNIPGLSIAIALPGGNKIERSYGLANLEHKIPVEKDSIFEIGSISKTFTSIGILMLQEEGKLSVNDRVTKYFPQYPGWGDITIKHLLQHTSGIKELTIVEPFKGNPMKSWTPQEIIARVSQEALDFEPGQKAQYSNTGCIILGLIIEKVTGISFGDFLSQRIIKPLEMTNTMLGSNSLIVPKRVAGYAFSGNLINTEYASLVMPYASGGMISTASDLIKLVKVFRGEALISKKSVNEMFAQVRLNDGTEYASSGPGLRITFGYGLDMVVKGKERIPAKTGGISGFNAFFAYVKDKDVMVAITANLNDSLGDLLIIADGLVGLREK